MFVEPFSAGLEATGLGDNNISFAVQQSLMFWIARIDERRLVGFVGTKYFHPWDYCDDFPGSKPSAPVFATDGACGGIAQRNSFC
jgi:hypothetical protein